MTSVLQTATFAVLGGVLPPLIWLWFWLKEDTRRPEPKALIGLAFLSGILAIAPVLFSKPKFIATSKTRLGDI
jgi:RsiW-degrading membrane proteinase PrsW (M82 family)